MAKKRHPSVRTAMQNSPKLQHDSDSGEEDNWDKIVYQVDDNVKSTNPKKISQGPQVFASRAMDSSYKFMPIVGTEVVDVPSRDTMWTPNNVKITQILNTSDKTGRLGIRSVLATSELKGKVIPKSPGTSKTSMNALEWQDDDDSDIFLTSNCTDRSARRDQALGDKSVRKETRDEARNLRQVETSRKRSQSRLQKIRRRRSMPANSRVPSFSGLQNTGPLHFSKASNLSARIDRQSKAQLLSAKSTVQSKRSRNAWPVPGQPAGKKRKMGKRRHSMNRANISVDDFGKLSRSAPLIARQVNHRLSPPRAVSTTADCKNNWMSNINDGFDLPKRKLTVSPAKTQEEIFDDSEVSAAYLEKNTWLEKNQKQLEKGVFGKTSKDLNAFTKSVGRKRTRFMVYSQTSKSTTNSSNTSWIEEEASISLKILRIEEERTFTHIYGCVVEVSNSFQEDNSLNNAKSPVIEMEGEYQIVVSSDCIGNANNLVVGASIKVIKPWTIVREYCQKDKRFGIIIGNSIFPA